MAGGVPLTVYRILQGSFNYPPGDDGPCITTIPPGFRRQHVNGTCVPGLSIICECAYVCMYVYMYEYMYIYMYVYIVRSCILQRAARTKT